MKIYFPHSRSFDYQAEWYAPLQASMLSGQHTLIFPHEEGKPYFSSKELMQQAGCDLVVAEVSYPATGLGMELAWADVFGIPCLCVHRHNITSSGSLQGIARVSIAPYRNVKEMVAVISTYITERSQLSS